ncbi:MAG: ATP-binding protein [Dissulfuribacterales bacterium]
MSLNNLANRLKSIKTIGFLSPILLTLIITLPLYFAAERTIHELAQSLTKELFLTELNRMITDINNHFERLKIVGLEDSEEHKEAIRIDAFKRFSEYSYKNTGSMFVIDNYGKILIGREITTTPWEDIRKSSTNPHKAQVIQYQQKDKKRWGVVVFYEPWQYYIGIAMDEDELFAQSIALQKLQLAMMAVSLLIAFLAVTISRYFFITPLTKLIRYADDIAAGRYDTQISGNFHWEFKQLKNALSIMVIAMVQRLQQIQVQLELITQRERERDAAIRQAEQEAERLNITLRSIADAVIAHDLSGKISAFNKAAEKMLGIKHDEVMGKPISLILSMLSHSRQQDGIKNTVAASLEFIGQYELKTKSGKTLQVSCTSNLIKDNQSRPIGTVMVIRDITTYTKLLAEMNKAQKLESLGLLAGGIAHDFNNILTTIMTATDMAAQLIEKDAQKAKEFLEKVEKAVTRAIGLTHQLLTFAKGGEPIKKAASIKDIVTESTEFMLAGSSTKCEFHFQDELWLADVDKNQISQVVQNIVLNARQAMHDKGHIWITCENFEKNQTLPVQANGMVNTTEEWSRLCPLALPAGKYLKLTIADNGPGIPKHLLDRIFEPYFTTKEHGNGLGLAISHSIVTKHGGCTVVESEEGKGTAFAIYLPAFEAEQPEHTSPMELVTKESGHRRLLLMDDDPMILELGSMLLRELGYEVLTASNGEDAITLYKNALKSEKPVDIVIMDITVKGGMGAKETMPKLMELNPNIIAVVSSGYSRDPIMANYKEYGFAAALPKPYRIQEMAAMLEQIADTAPKE